MARWFISTTALLYVLTLAPSSTTAFAPAVVSRNHALMTTTGTPSYVARPQGSYMTTTALNANLFDRFARVAKANINNVLKGMEDPEKVMEQALEDMQVSMNEIF
jgi:hypothetical protein